MSSTQSQKILTWWGGVCNSSKIRIIVHQVIDLHIRSLSFPKMKKTIVTLAMKDINMFGMYARPEFNLIKKQRN